MMQTGEREHKLSPHWKGPYKITKVINEFQVQYNENGRLRIANIIFCKKFFRSTLMATSLQDITYLRKEVKRGGIILTREHVVIFVTQSQSSRCLPSESHPCRRPAPLCCGEEGGPGPSPEEEPFSW